MIGVNNQVLNFFVAGSMLSPLTSSYHLRRRAEQQCTPVQREDDYDCVDSLFVLLDLDEKYEKHSGNLYAKLEQAVEDAYNSVTECDQSGADRSINRVSVLDNAKPQEYPEDKYPQINGTGLLFEIDMSCNSCGQDYWQIFDGTRVELDHSPSSPEDAHKCYCEGPTTLAFVGALQDTINESIKDNLTVINATQIPLLHPSDDSDYCNKPYSYTSFGYYGVCPGTKDKKFQCTNTDSPTESPTESPTYSPTSYPTQLSEPQPGDCPAGYEDRVYIHTGCTTGIAGFAEDADCAGGHCDMGPGYYCDDDSTENVKNQDLDQSYSICKDCASKKAYYEVKDGTWYCQM